MPGMVGAIQTFGDLIHFHPHIHALVSEGVFLPDGTFLPLPNDLLPGAKRNFQIFDLLDFLAAYPAVAPERRRKVTQHPPSPRLRRDRHPGAG